jgi:hypothetical protein
MGADASSSSATSCGVSATAAAPRFSSNRDDHLLAQRSEGLAHELLVVERPVDLGGVQEGDALHGAAQHLDHLIAVPRVRTEALAHTHAAEPQR